MARPKATTPTDRELAILHVLWQRGECSVREVHEELRKTVKVGYTSVQKIMQIMFDKGLVTRDESQQSHLYKAVKSRAETQVKITRNLLDKAFGGSAMHLVTAALSAKKVSPEELEHIKLLLETLDGEPLKNEVSDIVTLDTDDYA